MLFAIKIHFEERQQKGGMSVLYIPGLVWKNWYLDYQIWIMHYDVATEFRLIFLLLQWLYWIMWCNSFSGHKMAIWDGPECI